MKSFKLIKLLFQIYSGKKPKLEEVEKMGLLSIKLCQYYALRIDFLDEDLCIHLAKLYEKSYEKRPKKLSEIIGENNWIFKKLISYEEYPFASASIGQIHRGILKGGEKVAIKIKRKKFKNQFIEDIENSKKIFKIVLFFYPKLKKVFNPLRALEEIKKSTLNELDFKNEVNGAIFFESLKIKNFLEYDLSKLKFSNFYLEDCNENILVSKFIEGDSFNKLLNEKKLEYKTLLELFKYHSFYMFRLGVFHGDLHPGNIILDKKGFINLIDCSTVGKISEKLREGLFGFFYYLSRYDYLKASEYLNKMSITSIQEENFTKFQREFLKLYENFKDKTVGEVSLTRKMMETIKLGVNYNMEFEQGMFHVIKSLMYLDGMVLKCDKNINLMEDIREYTGVFKKEMEVP